MSGPVVYSFIAFDTYIATDHRRRWNHVVTWFDSEYTHTKTCDQVHLSPIDYMDCPVASRWTLMRTPS